MSNGELLTPRSIGLINDFTKALGQHLFFLGCDVEYKKGNLLCEYGFKRTKSSVSNSTSDYSLEFKGDTIFLHGLCIGRFSSDKPSFMLLNTYHNYPTVVYSPRASFTESPAFIQIAVTTNRKFTFQNTIHGEFID